MVTTFIMVSSVSSVELPDHYDNFQVYNIVYLKVIQHCCQHYFNNKTSLKNNN